MAMSNKIAVGNGRSINGILGGSFTLAGASAPTSIDGDIATVTRHVRGGEPNMFFRVRFKDSTALQNARSALHATAYLPDGLFASGAHATLGAFVADSGGLPDSQYEADVQVRDAAGALVDTASIRINVGGLLQV